MGRVRKKRRPEMRIKEGKWRGSLALPLFCPPLINSPFCMRRKNHFHIKGWTLNLALIRGSAGTRKKHNAGVPRCSGIKGTLGVYLRVSWVHRFEYLPRLIPLDKPYTVLLPHYDTTKSMCCLQQGINYSWSSSDRQQIQRKQGRESKSWGWAGGKINICCVCRLN